MMKQKTKKVLSFIGWNILPWVFVIIFICLVYIGSIMNDVRFPAHTEMDTIDITAVEDIEWVDMHKQSEWCEKIAYDENNQELFIMFANDEEEILGFSAFPKEQYDKFQRAFNSLIIPSGIWYEKNIKDNYECTCYTITDMSEDYYE